jgi:hypothetical protein
VQPTVADSRGKVTTASQINAKILEETKTRRHEEGDKKKRYAY